MAIFQPKMAKWPLKGKVVNSYSINSTIACLMSIQLIGMVLFLGAKAPLILAHVKKTKGSLQKKKLRNFGHGAKFLDPPPLGRYGRKKFGRLEWGRTPPSPSVVWTFGQKKVCE